TAGGLALLNDKGEQLVRRTKKENGKIKTVDNIRSAYFKLEKLVGNNYPLKLIRKTSATLLGEHAEHSRYVETFLGHRPSTMAGLHYVRPSQQSFDMAVAWLGEQYGN